MADWEIWVKQSGQYLCFKLHGTLEQARVFWDLLASCTDHSMAARRP